MDDSDKASADFASKGNGARAATDQTAYRDGFMPASLGINYTPCQAADARSSGSEMAPHARVASISRVETRRGTKKRRERSWIAKGNAKTSDHAPREATFPPCWWCECQRLV